MAAAASSSTAGAGAAALLEQGPIREGLAEVLPIPSQDGRGEVFYNPAQVFNRDLSIVVLAVFAKLWASTLQGSKADKPEGLSILEALAATGIRSIRYAKELGAAVRHVVANDLDEAAAAHIRRNVEHNGVRQGLVEVCCGDACGHMYSRRVRGPGAQPEGAYDVIDVDPYGTASPFLDAAVQAVRDGGLLCITSTDMPVLAGNYPETCFARYGGTALKAGYVHEMALRLLLHAVAASAARYGREVQPLLSCSVDFYVRVFVRVRGAAARVKRLASRTALVHQCVQCEAFAVQPLGEAAPEDAPPKFRPARVAAAALGPACPECGGGVRLGGPFYAGPLHDGEFVRLALEACGEGARGALPGVSSWRKIAGVLTAVSEEHADLPLYYKLPQLCKGLRLPPIPLRQFRGTLEALGYRASHFHREPEAVKTDAPNEVVYDLLRLWAEEHPVEGARPLPALLGKALTLRRPFQWVLPGAAAAPGPRVPRFLPNPEPNWGPKPRARGKAREARIGARPAPPPSLGEGAPQDAGRL